jgi:hypothetical protein
MATTATILHANLDALYASVEQPLDPSTSNVLFCLGTDCLVRIFVEIIEGPGGF